MKNALALLPFVLLLSACQEGGGNGATTLGASAGTTNPASKGTVSDWQSSLLGQEGHGGDALVCFSILVDRALYKVNVGESNQNEKKLHTRRTLQWQQRKQQWCRVENDRRRQKFDSLSKTT
ncbi:MAG: hypothetical protein HUU57_08865 [Bdellovibrio sp.]|nr:hypothetical protein [Bdellovibrio sp.]